ncbi:MAG TPA: double zinc ribbon domain-containing protein [Ktedonobacterales bacterium]|nr:double zinc ribbon domain-containing protein [Ktedonobacterales bacterium]
MADLPGVSAFGELAQGLLDLVFPPRCVGCRARGAIFCAACLAQVQAPPDPICAQCGLPLQAAAMSGAPILAPAVTSARCPECASGRGSVALTGLRMAAFHEGGVRKAIHAFKYAGQRRAARPLGDLLAVAYHRYQREGMVADLIIPLPLHTARERERGYNQATLLARRLAARLRLPLRADLLVRLRATPPQVGLRWQARRANVAGAFALAGPHAAAQLAGKRILLIDDVATTGSTLDAAAQALLLAGPAAIWGLTVTRPMRRDANS